MFLSILTKIGGCCVIASQTLQEDWIKDSKADCGIELQLGMSFNYNYEQMIMIGKIINKTI